MEVSPHQGDGSETDHHEEEVGEEEYSSSAAGQEATSGVEEVEHIASKHLVFAPDYTFEPQGQIEWTAGMN